MFVSKHVTSSCFVLTSGDGYSLEEARKKREEDKLLAAADAKKRGVRAYVQELRTYAPTQAMQHCPLVSNMPSSP